MATFPPQSPAEWRDWYRASAEAQERVWLQELAALTDEEALARTLSLRLFAPMADSSSDWSGLVEQQALFRRMSGPA